MEIVDEQDDVGSGVGSSDAYVVEFAADAEGDQAGLVDAVVADAGVGVGVTAVGGPGLGEGGVDRCRGRAVGQGPVGALVVVGVGELVEQVLQLGMRGGLVGLGV
ncbi:hypothetical protein ACH4ZX_31815 [Streptomyces sp. NPDC020490]|uniref:hypothetical protein n=1 Tax=Streptomyces sp. NPDC020490 TaxID=3365078 RepID=UPI00378B8AEC